MPVRVSPSTRRATQSADELVAEIVAHSHTVQKKSSRTALLPLLRSLTLFSVEHGPGMEGMSNLFNALVRSA